MKLCHISIPCQVHLGQVELSADEYHQLRVGDVILLDRQVTDMLEVCAANTTLFKVTAGLDGMRKAVSIQEKCKQDIITYL